MKAWQTRRAAKTQKSMKESKKQKKEKTIKAKVKAVSNEADKADLNLSADEKREMIALNGTDLEKLAKETQKRMDRKELFENARQGHQDKKAVSVGNIIKKAKIERFNGGIKFSKVGA